MTSITLSISFSHKINFVLKISREIGLKNTQCPFESTIKHSIYRGRKLSLLFFRKLDCSLIFILNLISAQIDNYTCYRTSLCRTQPNLAKINILFIYSFQSVFQSALYVLSNFLSLTIMHCYIYTASAIIISNSRPIIST